MIKGYWRKDFQCHSIRPRTIKRYNLYVKPIWYYVLNLNGRNDVSWDWKSAVQVHQMALDNIF